MLKALAGPFPDAVFCPTGGITRATAPDYLALANVACVGGSWVAPADQVRAGDWKAIEELARDAACLSRQDARVAVLASKPRFSVVQARVRPTGPTEGRQTVVALLCRRRRSARS